uniref:superoxide dismutase n=1 Tax=Ixodes ricinus TaxID=34613 RepID=A0A0K8RID0_IXORI
MVFSILVLIIVLQPAWCGIAPPYHGLDRPSLEYELPPLPYVFDALEPYIDEETLRIHYFGHHAKYTREMNRAFKEWRKYLKDKHASRLSLIDILRNFTRVPAKYRSTLIHNVEGGDA